MSDPNIPASQMETREELGRFYADVIHVSAGIVANPSIGQLLPELAANDDRPPNVVAGEWVADLALAVVQAADRLCYPPLAVEAQP